MFYSHNGLPFFYDHINLANCISEPSEIHAHNTGLKRYFYKYLIQRAMSVYQFTLPEKWNTRYFLWVLFTCGYIGILDTEEFGTICQWGTFQGYDIYYYPKRMIFTNPAFKKTEERTIDKDCVLLNLKDMTGFSDICSFYADMLAVLFESFGINAIQAKNTDIYGASDKKTAEELKKTTDLIMSGKPAVFVSDKLFNDDGSLNCVQFKEPKDYFGTELLDNAREIISMFDHEIGIPTAPDKKERLISKEVSSQSYEATSRSEMWLENLKKDCEKARKMFNIELDVDFRYNVFDELADNNTNMTVDAEGGD